MLRLDLDKKEYLKEYILVFMIWSLDSSMKSQTMLFKAYYFYLQPLNFKWANKHFYY